MPVGAVFAKANLTSPFTFSVVASSHNLTNKLADASRHCEMICLEELQEKGEDTRDLILAVSVEPCIMCAYALNLAGIK